MSAQQLNKLIISDDDDSGSVSSDYLNQFLNDDDDSSQEEDYKPRLLQNIIDNYDSEQIESIRRGCLQPPGLLSIEKWKDLEFK